MRKIPLHLALLTLLAGCMSGPDYVGPPGVASVSGESFLRAGPEIDPQAPHVADWWTLLGDPVLNELETRALGAGQPATRRSGPSHCG